MTSSDETGAEEWPVAGGESSTPATSGADSADAGDGDISDGDNRNDDDVNVNGGDDGGDGGDDGDDGNAFAASFPAAAATNEGGDNDGRGEATTDGAADDPPRDEASAEAGGDIDADAVVGADADTANRATDAEEVAETKSGDDAAAAPPPRRLPSLPLKRARTAYFIFADDKREGLKALYKGEGVAVLARATGKLWSSLEPDEKSSYEQRAADERERVADDTRLLREAGLLPPENGGDGKGNGGGGGGNGGGTTTGASLADVVSSREAFLPVARVRRIAKLDPDVRGVSKEATALLAKAAECFVASLGKEAVSFAGMQNRRKLLPEDVVEVSSVRERFLFLKEDLRDFAREGKRKAAEEKQREGEKKRKTGGKGSAEAVGGKATKTLDSYFGAAVKG